MLSQRRGSSAAHRWGRLRPAWIAALLLLLALPWLSVPARAQSPSSSPGASTGVIGSGDPRSEGEGAGLVGDPLLVALGVVALGAMASGGTLLYLRLTRDT